MGFTCLVMSYLKCLRSKVLRSEETESKLFIKKQKFSSSTQLPTGSGPGERNAKSSDICSRVRVRISTIQSVKALNQ